MIRPSISRAVPMGVLGFMVGALVVIVVRWLQSLTPLWDVGSGLVFGTFFCAFFFLWGIGAFDPRLSAHGDEAHDDHAPAEKAADEPNPNSVFGNAIWQVTFATMLFIVAVMVMAAVGPVLITASDPEADARAVGMVPMELFGQQLVVSQLTIFAIFVIFTLISLVVAAWLISFAVTELSRGLVETRAIAAGTLPPPAPREAPTSALAALKTIVVFIIVLLVLYLLFYYVLIGLVLPNPPWLLVMLSFVNALIVTILILSPVILIRVISSVAGWTARLLRSRSQPDGARKAERRDRP